MSDVFDKNNHISRQRRSRDPVLNHEGKVLLDVCKANNLIILNGRCGSDKSSGELTFRNISVIDYSITTPNLVRAARSGSPMFNQMVRVYTM